MATKEAADPIHLVARSRVIVTTSRTPPTSLHTNDHLLDGLRTQFSNRAQQSRSCRAGHTKAPLK
jgi:hypothetical protein